MVKRFVLALALIAPGLARAQQLDGDASVFEHPDAPFWFSAQANVIAQHHGEFHSAYEGANSLQSSEEAAVSFVGTAYGGLRVARWTALYFDLESAAGHGLSDALGLAGITNLDVVRNPTLGTAPYIARAFAHQVIPLSNETDAVDRGPLQVSGELPRERIELRAGKFGTADFFDTNKYGSDSHFQFMNWTIDSNGAFDYAADTRGYSVGAMIEYDRPNFAARFGEMMMPTVANGPVLDTDLAHARGQHLEFEFHRGWFTSGETVIRVLGYWNLADEGSYAEAIDAFESGRDARIDIAAHRKPGRATLGGGANFEQPIADSLALFGRIGANDGHNESFAFTEVNDTLELGFFASGARWARPLDRAGVAGVTNGLSALHREYLALGGSGFLLGDGGLRYGRECIAEGFYTLALGRGLFAAADLQAIADPGYNRDRGPVVVSGLRLHLEI